MCRSYLPAALTPETCTVYSFGIAGAWGFDDSMADAGCTVHSFDPTAKFRPRHESHVHERVTFHYVGLRGRPDDSSQAEGNAATYYGALGGRMLDLGEIMEELGHKRIDVLKLDCEGCEWEAFAHLAPTCADASQEGSRRRCCHERNHPSRPTNHPRRSPAPTRPVHAFWKASHV